MFWHRFMNRHVWETVDEYRVKGLNLEATGFQGRGFDIEGSINRLRAGFKVVHQECGICGDRRTLRES